MKKVERTFNVEVPETFTNLREFDVNAHTKYKYHYNNCNNEFTIYYVCSSKKEGCKGTAKSKILNNMTIEIVEFGPHSSHLIIPKKERITKETKNKVIALVKENLNLPPSKIQSQFIEKYPIFPIPPLSLVQNTKKNFLFPDVMEILKNHGSSFNGSTRFIKLFSLNPFIVIMANDQILNEIKAPIILFIDDTFSVLNISSKLMAIITVYKGKGIFFFKN